MKALVLFDVEFLNLQESWWQKHYLKRRSHFFVAYLIYGFVIPENSKISAYQIKDKSIFSFPFRIIDAAVFIHKVLQSCKRRQ